MERRGRSLYGFVWLFILRSEVLLTRTPLRFQSQGEMRKREVKSYKLRHQLKKEEEENVHNCSTGLCRSEGKFIQISLAIKVN
jgi:hypothetical protein